MRWGRLDLFSLFDVLGELSECSIEALLIRVVIVPFLGGLGPILGVIIFGQVWIWLMVEGLIVGRECSLWGIQAIEGLQDLGLMNHPLIRLQILLIVIGCCFVFIGTEEMVSIGIAEALLHIVGGDILKTSFNFAILISGLISLVFELLHMLKLGMLAK